MSLPNYLAKIKSSGIYRFVWDKSEVTPQQAETLRLVVGYSEKGPFNTPVYVDNEGDFKTIFGDVNKKLERRGVFFHRMALQALAAGPIIALNLKKFTNEQVQYACAEGVGELKLQAGTSVKNVFNTSRFWNLDPDLLTDVSKFPAPAGRSPYLVVTATDSKESSNSIIIRPCAVDGYDITVKSWYAATGEDMPDYFLGHEDLLVSDFFAEVYVFKGEFTPALASSAEFAKFFNVSGTNVTLASGLTDAFGAPVDTLDALSESEISGFIGKYTGVTIPYFKGMNGSYISLDLVFNVDQPKHKMMMKLNSTLLEDGDITPANITTNAFDDITASYVNTMISAEDSTVVLNGLNVLSCTNANPTFNKIGVATITGDETDWVFGDAFPIHFATDVINGVGSEKKVLGTLGLTDVNFTIIAVGDATFTGNQIKFTADSDVSLFKTQFPDAAKGTRYLIMDGVGATEPSVATLLSSKLTGEGESEVLTLTFSTNSVKPIKVNGKNYIVRCDRPITSGASIKPLYVKGYERDASLVKPLSSSIYHKKQWQKSILNTINPSSDKGYPGLVEALTNRVDIDYRYIVDTFESFPGQECKAELSLIAKKKDNCLLLTNFPSIQSFIKDGYVDGNGAFNMKFVKSTAGSAYIGGDPFTLPSAENGASWCSFNTPVVFSDGVVKTVVPAAALVSNNFMAKYAGRQPYYIVAGPTYGRLVYPNMIGPDYNFSRPDLDILEPLGVNATVFVPRKGTYINSNQTAKQTPVTALSKINVRELVIYLQDEIESLLQNYQWEFNTPTLRDLIKAKADTICQNVQANGGIYDFKNTCDNSNNTDEVINNEMIVLSTSIEPGMGCGKMVQELTIYKKGGMSSVITNG